MSPGLSGSRWISRMSAFTGGAVVDGDVHHRGRGADPEQGALQGGGVERDRLGRPVVPVDHARDLARTTEGAGRALAGAVAKRRGDGGLLCHGTDPLLVIGYR